MNIIDDYCIKIEDALRKDNLSMPVGGVVTPNFYSYPLPREHLKCFSVNENRSPVFDFGLTVYRRMQRAMHRKKYPLVLEEGVCCLIDRASAEALKNLAENESATGIIKKGEKYLILSVIKTEPLNDNRIRELAGEMATKVDGKLKEIENLAMYV